MSGQMQWNLGANIFRFKLSTNLTFKIQMQTQNQVQTENTPGFKCFKMHENLYQIKFHHNHHRNLNDRDESTSERRKKKRKSKQFSISLRTKASE